MEGDHGGNFLMHKAGGLPIWAWGLIGIAGVGIGYYFITRNSSAIPTGTQASNTSAGTVSADPGSASLQPSNAGGPNNPFPEIPVGNGSVPVLPNGYTPIYDNNGNLVGFEPPAPPPSVTPPASQIFLGPTGVKHYVVQAGDSLSSIAAKFGLASWNSIYAIPANQSIFGKLSAAQARSYQPRPGTVITLPGNAVAPTIYPIPGPQQPVTQQPPQQPSGPPQQQPPTALPLTA